MKKLSLLCFFVLFLQIPNAIGQIMHPDSTVHAMNELLAHQKVAAQFTNPSKAQLHELLKFGLWDKALVLIEKSKLKQSEKDLLTASYYFYNNMFSRAQTLVDNVLKSEPNNAEALVANANLEVQAWRLSSAEQFAKKAIESNAGNVSAQIMLGRIKLLQKKYEEALAIAKSVEIIAPTNAEAYLLEADVYFWNQHPEKAEAPLIRSLELDPFNPDARFSYGYAIWRRVDATQLNAMAAQWDLALALNPLHYQTNWHWGNGHTNLTYADYAEVDDEQIRKELSSADDFVRNNQLEQAVQITYKVQAKYPNSVLPRMQRASIYYSDFSSKRTQNLDSAEQLFRELLHQKKHYGPAHNGLSAIIKSKRIPFLAAYDSISNSLKNTKITDPDNFLKVFPDVAYYPGQTAKAMVWNQMYTSIVYFPFLSKEGNSFRIPPLHQDLAITMKSPSFRFMTTFDNRQWMDIRGVGSGAAAIEYVERGAFMERNVILHEYVHLFHGSVLTDQENRKIRALYYNAMKEHRTLDYYSQNNESEYFAQTYPAYFEPVKVHPLDFKSMNTTSDLKAKDPEMYNFIDSLVKKERAYLSGDKKAMASNWAEVYLNLSNDSGYSGKAIAYLDTALTYDAKYLPVYLRMAEIYQYKRDFAAASRWLDSAKSIDPKYPPIYASYSLLAAAKYADKQIDQETAVKQQAAYLKQSLSLESDYQEIARVSLMLREMYRRNALYIEAIQVADEYGKNGATVSTYLRDRRDEALAYSATLRSAMGDQTQSEVLKKLVEQKPQNFEFRNQYADILAQEHNFTAAINTIKEAQRILSASGNARSDYKLRLAEYYQMRNQPDSAAEYVKQLATDKTQLRTSDQLRYVRLLIQAKNIEIAEAIFKNFKPSGDKTMMAEYRYTQAKLYQAEKKLLEYVLALNKTIQENPYYLPAYLDLKEHASSGKDATQLKKIETLMKTNSLK
ncbi:tetratricopeptide repeat protein [Pedobacter sp. PWIIR3]